MARLTSYLIFITTCSFAIAVYFPMNDLMVNVPLDPYGDQGGFTGFTILDVRALSDRGERLRFGDVVFKIVNSKQSDYFTLDRISGRLKLSEKFPSTFVQGKTKSVPLEIEAVERQRNTSVALLRVMINLKQLSQFVNCESLSANDICFWPSVRYEVVENRDGTILGTPGPRFYEQMCPEYNVVYRIVEGKGNVTVEKIDSEWVIHTQHALERDFHPKDESDYQKRYTVGPKMNISLLCTVTGPRQVNNSITETLKVFVRDENDNPPVPQFPFVLNTYLPSATVKKGSELIFSEPLIIQDLDSPDVNNFTVELLDDADHLLNLTHIVHENDHKGEVQTFLLLELSFAKSKRIVNFPYTAIVRINDTTLTPGHGNSSFNVTIRIHNGPETPPSPSSLIQLTHVKMSGLLYPSLSLKLLRTAAPFARLTQPRDNANLTNIKTFRVKNDSTNVASQKKRGAFDVTKKGGIVYVKEISMLRDAPPTIELEIEWKYKNGTSLVDIFTIQLVNEEKETCGGKGDDANDWYTCAFYNTKKKCTDGCGLATGGSVSVLHSHTLIKRAQRCVWRSSALHDSPVYTTNYDTCTPETTTCPDQICDPLEDLYHRICPQDCTEKVMMGEINISGRGIGVGMGVCTCSNNGDCVCSLNGHTQKEKTTASTSTMPTTTTITTDRVIDFATIPNGSNFQKNKDAVEVALSNYHLYKSSINTKKADPNVRCDLMCMVGIICGGIFLLASLTGLFIICRIRKTNKLGRRDRKYINSVTALSTMQSEYFDRGGGIRTPDTLPLNFDMNISLPMSTTISMIDGKHAPDPKWEFPRSKLNLEQTLGEGEFGKVLRAKAFEIAGIPGYTTVAVKTLKDNSRTSELNDLMSEYELLKEISHPNVIRLLGACTLPGGPVYLIIEFAEHGSLRNYLRQSRHIESDSGIPNTGALLETTETENRLNDDIMKRSVPFITPKDVMSFAWQISKGMAYLGDIKLVHRDLAARNVLLASGKVCKISDFGLTRDVYEDDAYLKRSKGRVPVKWMAPESLADHVYTSKSDVWSFGILLWELVTLGASPYPGVAVENLFHLLKSGYRMERPENCSPHLYHIMKSCWELEPAERPSFRSLTEKFEHMLEDGVEYLDLNPRIVHNRTYFAADMSTNFDTSDGSDDFVVKSYKNIPITISDSINFSKQNEPVKCADSNKLPLWEPPSLVIKNQYENEMVKPTQTLVLNHYESPVKVRNKNGLLTPTNDRPQSYIDMAGNSTNIDEEQTLLNDTNEQNTNTVTSF